MKKNLASVLVAAGGLVVGLGGGLGGGIAYGQHSVAGGGTATPEMSPEEMAAKEGVFLGKPIALTMPERFVKAGESYFSPVLDSEGRWVIFQATERPEAGKEADPFYGMYVGKVRMVGGGGGESGGTVVGMDEKSVRRISPPGTANTCGWFVPAGSGWNNERARMAGPTVMYGSTVTPPKASEKPGFQVGTNRYVWMFPEEMEIVRQVLPMEDGRLKADAAASADAMKKVFERTGYDAECSVDATGRFVLYAGIVPAKEGWPEAKPDADIFVFDTMTKKTHTLVSAAGYDGGPFFSPDGKSICYRSDRAGNDLLQLFVADLKFERDADTGVMVPVGVEREYQITANEHVNWAPFWHPSGLFLIYGSSEFSHRNYELFAIEVNRGKMAEAAKAHGEKPGPVVVDGLERKRITYAAGADILPAFTPDGKWLMWTSQRGRALEGETKPSSQLWMAEVKGEWFAGVEKAMRGPAKEEAKKPDSAPGTGVSPAAAFEGEPVELLGELSFCEGPSWIGDRFYFADMPRGVVYSWGGQLEREGKGAPVEAVKDLPKPLGISADVGGKSAVFAEVGERRIVKRAIEQGADGTVKFGEAEVVSAGLDGKRLNATNDVVVRQSDGTVWFTDPTFFTKKSDLELDYSAVGTAWKDADGKWQSKAVMKDLKLPNGLAFSTDEKTLYVNDFGGNKVMAYVVEGVGADAKLGEGRVFADLKAIAKSNGISVGGNADGIRVDMEGNVYTTGPAGVWVLSRNGEVVAHLPVHRANNLAFGGADGKTMLITCGTRVVGVRTKVAGNGFGVIDQKKVDLTVPPEGAVAPDVLEAGEVAPPLVIGSWVKGWGKDGAIDQGLTSGSLAFDKDKLYVVEMWATWCGPCRRMMPALSSLQQQYAASNVNVLGLSIWEGSRPLTQEEIEKSEGFESRVKKFVTDNPSLMRYAVAYSGENGMEDPLGSPHAELRYMKDAMQWSIPSTFVIDGGGYLKSGKRDGVPRILWIGHPSYGLEQTVAEIVADHNGGAAFDVKAAQERANAKKQALQDGTLLNARMSEAINAKEFDKAIEITEAMYKLDPQVFARVKSVQFQIMLTGKKDVEGAYAFARQQMEGVLAQEPDALTYLAQVVVSDPGLDDVNGKSARDAKFAVEVADRAIAVATQRAAAGKGDGPSAWMWDVLAKARLINNDAKGAVEAGTKAAEVAEEPFKTELTAKLRDYARAVERVERGEKADGGEGK